jgi:hypothetical protein
MNRSAFLQFHSLYTGFCVSSSLIKSPEEAFSSVIILLSSVLGPLVCSLSLSTSSWPRHWLEVSGQLHAHGVLPPPQRERAPGTHWIGGWAGLIACLDDVEKWKFVTLPGLELWPLSRPARSQSLYRLRCLPSFITFRCHEYTTNVSHKIWPCEICPDLLLRFKHWTVHS